MDNCATTNFIGEPFVRRHHQRITRRPTPLHIDFASVTTEVSTRTVPNVVITLGNYIEKLIFEIVNINHNIILGKPWLEDHAASILIPDEVVNFSYKDE